MIHRIQRPNKHLHNSCNPDRTRAIFTTNRQLTTVATVDTSGQVDARPIFVRASPCSSQEGIANGGGGGGSG
jgi:hypothetical protein